MAESYTDSNGYPIKPPFPGSNNQLNIPPIIHDTTIHDDGEDDDDDDALVMSSVLDKFSQLSSDDSD